MRILVIIAIVVILYIIIKSLIGKNTKLSQKTKKNISYCQDCDTYMPHEEMCKTKNIHLNECENYKRNS